MQERERELAQRGTVGFGTPSQPRTQRRTTTRTTTTAQTQTARTQSSSASGFVTDPYAAPGRGQKVNLSKSEAHNVVRRYQEDNPGDIVFRLSDGRRVVTGDYSQIEGIMKKVPGKSKVEVESRVITNPNNGERSMSLYVRISKR